LTAGGNADLQQRWSVHALLTEQGLTARPTAT